MRPGRRGGGFTLLEVMIALGILAMSLVILLGTAARSVRAATRARMIGVVTELARGKMLDIEEELLHQGFQDMAETLEGDFEDEEHPEITWSALVEKVELPDLGAMQTAVGSEEGDPAAGAAGMGGVLGGDPTAAAGFAMISSQFELVRGVLEQAIRKVTLTVTYKLGGKPESMVVVCYFTDTKAVDTALRGAPPAEKTK